MLGCVERGGVETEALHYSTGDYCDSADSSMRQGELPEYTVSPRRGCRLNQIPRCPRKHYRLPVISSCYHQPKAVHSFPNKRFHRTGGRRPRRFHHLEETTSMDEHKSITSYSSMLTVDVSREMEAVNRDIEEIIRRCDDYCQDGVTPCKTCCHRHHRKTNKGHRGLTQDQMRILSMKRPPIDKLKDVPLSLLKPRPPRHSFKEKSLSAPHTKYKTSRDIRNIVEETDALLRNVYKELSRGKRQEARTEDEEACHHCEGTRGVSDLRPATCLERYLGCQNKCRRVHENRWIRPKWKDVFEKSDFYKMIKPNDDRTKHFHDTNCISEPTTSSCLIRVKKGKPGVPRTTVLKDIGVNTESQDGLTKSLGEPDRPGPDQSYLEPRKEESQRTDDPSEKKYPIDLHQVKAFINYTSDNMSGRTSHFKSFASGRRRSGVDLYGARLPKEEEQRPAANPTSLLLDRDMGLALDKVSNLKTCETKSEMVDEGIPLTSKELESATRTSETFVSHDYFGGTPRSGIGGGDSMTVLESSKTFISQIVNKIVNKPIDWTSSTHVQTVDIASLEKQNGESEDVDTGICLEIMKRLVDLMSRHHRKQLDHFKEVSPQYARVRKMKQQHLTSIEKEITSIQDLEFYLKNASLAGI